MNFLPSAAADQQSASAFSIPSLPGSSSSPPTAFPSFSAGFSIPALPTFSAAESQPQQSATAFAIPGLPKLASASSAASALPAIENLAITNSISAPFDSQSRVVQSNFPVFLQPKISLKRHRSCGKESAESKLFALVNSNQSIGGCEKIPRSLRGLSSVDEFVRSSITVPRPYLLSCWIGFYPSKKPKKSKLKKVDSSTQPSSAGQHHTSTSSSSDIDTGVDLIGFDFSSPSPDDFARFRLKSSNKFSKNSDETQLKNPSKQNNENDEKSTQNKKIPNKTSNNSANKIPDRSQLLLLFSSSINSAIQLIRKNYINSLLKATNFDESADSNSRSHSVDSLIPPRHLTSSISLKLPQLPEINFDKFCLDYGKLLIAGANSTKLIDWPRYRVFPSSMMNCNALVMEFPDFINSLDSSPNHSTSSSASLSASLVGNLLFGSGILPLSLFRSNSFVSHPRYANIPLIRSKRKRIKLSFLQSNASDSASGSLLNLTRLALESNCLIICFDHSQHSALPVWSEFHSELIRFLRFFNSACAGSIPILLALANCSKTKFRDSVAFITSKLRVSGVATNLIQSFLFNEISDSGSEKGIISNVWYRQADENQSKSLESDNPSFIELIDSLPISSLHSSQHREPTIVIVEKVLSSSSSSSGSVFIVRLRILSGLFIPDIPMRRMPAVDSTNYSSSHSSLSLTSHCFKFRSGIFIDSHSVDPMKTFEVECREKKIENFDNFYLKELNNLDMEVNQKKIECEAANTNETIQISAIPINFNDPTSSPSSTDRPALSVGDFLFDLDYSIPWIQSFHFVFMNPIPNSQTMEFSKFSFPLRASLTRILPRSTAADNESEPESAISEFPAVGISIVRLLDSNEALAHSDSPFFASAHNDAPTRWNSVFRLAASNEFVQLDCMIKIVKKLK